MNSSTTERGDVLVKTGAVVFLIGAAATLATFVPLFLHLTPLPTAAYWISMLMPLGLGLALTGMFREARAKRPAKS
ncbi:hypothetical protein [Kitasatospora sp. NPDC004289]